MSNTTDNTNTMPYFPSNCMFCGAQYMHHYHNTNTTDYTCGERYSEATGWEQRCVVLRGLKPLPPAEKPPVEHKYPAEKQDTVTFTTEKYNELLKVAAGRAEVDAENKRLKGEIDGYKVMLDGVKQGYYMANADSASDKRDADEYRALRRILDKGFSVRSGIVFDKHFNAHHNTSDYHADTLQDLLKLIRSYENR